MVEITKNAYKSRGQTLFYLGSHHMTQLSQGKQFQRFHQMLGILLHYGLGDGIECRIEHIYCDRDEGNAAYTFEVDWTESKMIEVMRRFLIFSEKDA